MDTPTVRAAGIQRVVGFSLQILPAYLDIFFSKREQKLCPNLLIKKRRVPS
jgi:hypothetical protein